MKQLIIIVIILLIVLLYIFVFSQVNYLKNYSMFVTSTLNTFTPHMTHDCGQIAMLGQRKTETTNQSEDCFYHSFQNCTPATLRFTQAGIDAGTIHSFQIKKNTTSCTIVDRVQFYISPRPPTMKQTDTCSSLSRQTDGLHISDCAHIKEIVIPK